MASFQKIVIISAIVILIISLIFISFALVYSHQNVSWPPNVGDCPDYWIDTSGNGENCVNVKNLGTCKPTSGTKHLTMNFNIAPYIGANGNCAKYTWANNCGLAWDGINYGVKNPCAGPSSSTSSNNNSNRFTSWVSSLFTSRQNYN